MNLGIKNKKALVTGGGRGIGRAIALDLAREGAKVAVVSRTESDLKEVIAKMGGRKKGHYYFACDLAKEKSAEKTMKAVFKNFGTPDIMINNVGETLGIVDPYCSIKDWRKVFRINLEVAVEFNNLVIPNMKKKRWGRIINIASTASMENNGPIAYCSAKAALPAYTRSLGRVLASEGIVVSTVLPGAVAAPGSYWDKAQRQRPEHARKYLRERCPLLRFGTPEEISGMVVFLCSELASFCQGSIIPVDGGQSRHFFSTQGIGD